MTQIPANSVSPVPRLNVVVDVAPLQGLFTERGIPRYVRDLLNALNERDLDLFLRVHRELKPLPVGDPLESQVASDRQLKEIFRHCDKTHPAVFVLSSPFEWGPSGTNLLPQWITRTGVPVVAIGYDAIPWLMPEVYLQTPGEAARYRARIELLKTVDLVLTISKASREDFIKEFGLDPRKVVAIGTGVSSERFSRASVLTTEELFELRDVVCVAGYEPRKNVERLIAAWGKIPHAIRQSHRLVIVCDLPEDGRRHWQQLISDSGLMLSEVKLTGKISDEELIEILSSSKLAVMPSLYEGFGLPVAEAASMGVPVITSNVSALPEILDDPESVFDPFSVDSIASKLSEALSSRSLYERLLNAVRGKQDSLGWQSVADAAIENMSKLVRWDAPRGSLVRSTAILTPLAPSLSGVATYTHRVLSAMNPSDQFSIFRDDTLGPDGAELAHGEKSARVFPLVADSFDFDEILVVLGNSDYHVNSYRFALRNPSHVWFHDLNLAGLVVSAAFQIRDLKTRVAWINELIQQEKLGVDLRVDQKSYGDIGWYRKHGVRFLNPVLAIAKSVVVNSTYAKHIIESSRVWHGQPILVSPLAHQPPPTPYEESSTPLIVSLGWVGPTKSPRTLIDVLHFTDDSVRLVFAGPIDSDYEEKLRSHAAQSGLGDRVSFTGPVTDDDYSRWCQRAWVGVQLRSDFHGESSATVRDFMSASRPVITDIPTALELPDGSVRLVPQGASARHIASEVNRLIGDEELRRLTGARARKYLENWTFADVARNLNEHLAGWGNTKSQHWLEIS
jgi:glycosyltransferase involved in cell wall biosynthesis